MKKENKKQKETEPQTIGDLAKLMKSGFDSIDKRFEQVDKRFDDMSKDMNRRFGEVEKKIIHLDERTSQTLTYVENIDGEVENLNKKIEDLNNKTSQILAYAENIDGEVEDIKESMEQKADVSDVHSIKIKVKTLEKDVNILKHLSALKG